MVVRDSDDQLVKRAIAGSDRAWQSLVKRYETPLYNHAYRMVGHREDALDLLQDVLLSIYRNLENFRGDAPFRAWMFRIATFRCTDHLRRKRPDVSEFEESADPDALNNPASGFENVRSNQEILGLLQKLPPDQRHVVELKFFQHFTFDEISRQLGISTSTAKTRLYTALRTLRKSPAARIAASRP